MGHRLAWRSSAVLWIIMLSCLGCQGGPTAPETETVYQSSVQAAQSRAPGHHCMGVYALTVDTQSLEAEMLPLRGCDWHFNLTGILNTTMGVGVAMVPAECDPTHGLFAVDVTLNHPFATKPQFAGFDVKGVLMTPGTLAVGSLLFADADETELENADGYTRWWNPTEFTQPGLLGYTQGILANAPGSSLTATVNPYRLFADILGADGPLSLVSDEPLDSDQGRAVFTAGSSNTRRYRIRFPMDPGPKVVLGYAIDCSWNAPSPNPPAEVPDDFPIEANQPEAYRIGLVPTAGSLYYDSESGTGGGTITFQINVHDWQGQEAGDIQSEIAAVRIFAPDLMATGVDAVFLNETSNKARYTADLTGSAVPTHSGDTKIICRVGSTDGSNYQQTGAPAPDSTLSAFQAITLDIPDPDCVPDTNDNFSEAINLDLKNPTVDQMCAPDDYRDFFVMDLPLGNTIAGAVRLLCDPEPTKFALYDQSEALIKEVSVSGGTAALDLGSLGVMPGKYYLRVLTQTSGEAFFYMIVPNLEIVDITPHAVDVTPDGLYFDPWWVQGYGQLAIASCMNGLWIYDYSSDLYDPELLSYTKTHIHQKPGLAYPYLYTSDGNVPSSIGMIDLTDPSAPVVHDNIMTASDFVMGLNAEPGYLYLCTQGGPVDIYDISTNPLAPVLVGTIPGSAAVYESTIVHDATGPESCFVLSNHSYYLTMYDITDKANITFFGSISGGLTAIMWALASTDNHLFVLEEESPSYYLWAGHIDSILGLVYDDGLTLVQPATMLDVGGGLAFPTGDTLIARVDISDPFNLGSPGTYSFSEATILDMDVEGDHFLHALGPAGIRYVSTGIADYGRTFGLSETGQMAIDGDYMFTIDGDGIYRAIKSVDISDPAAAFVAGDVMLDQYPLLLTVKNGRMVTFTSGDRLKTIDCTDPPNMVVHNDYAASQYVTAMGMTDSALFLGCFDGSIEVKDLSSWPALSPWTTIPGTDAAKIFLFRSNVMYVVAGGNILVYVITNPGSPSLVDTYYPLEAVGQMTINGDYLYIATADSLEIADISNPLDPVFVATEPHPDAPNGENVAAVDQFAILQPYMTTPPTVMRVWPPDDPTVIGALYGPEYATKPTQVLVNNGYYYERSPEFALRIWGLY